MKTELLSTLKIHKLSQEQYDRELSAGNIDETALYLTPEEDLDLSSYAQISDLDTKAEIEHTHDASDITSGILPLSAGGTGQDMSARTQNAIIRFSSGGNYFSSTPTADGAFFATSANGAPSFGTLPVAQGGTGGTTPEAARANLGVYGIDEIDSKLETAGNADSVVATHNSSTSAHSDIRKSISDLGASVDGIDDKIDGHTSDANIHVTAEKKSQWDAAYTHAGSTHARVDATKTEKSSTNGNILINGAETVVYQHPTGTNPHGTTKSDVGLGNVDNTSDMNKPVSTAQQNAIDAVQSNLNVVDDKVDDHIANTNIHFTATERTKLSNIAENANNYTHPTSGVSAGTYKSVVVDSNGHVTSGSNPTTLAGYGITDAEEKGAVNTHNSSDSSHSDIRLLISDVSTKLNNFLNVNDTTKDQLSEIIALIDNNADDIEKITSGKVNVSDIINNLTTNLGDKPLSAAQGVELKSLIDNMQSAINEDISNLTSHSNDMGLHVSSLERSNWDNAFEKMHTHHNASILENTSASYTTGDQTKLESIEFGANKTIVDSSLSNSSDNPVANKVVNAAIETKVDKAAFEEHNLDGERHIVDSERTLWNTVTNKVDSSDYNSHLNDENPHNIDERLAENSDVTVTELGYEVIGVDPDIDPVVEQRINLVSNDLDSTNIRVDRLSTSVSSIEIAIAELTSVVSSMNSSKAEKNYVVAIFDQIKELILNGETEDAVAVLDKAILDLTTLA